jgi:hypothetical protein
MPFLLQHDPASGNALPELHLYILGMKLLRLILVSLLSLSIPATAMAAMVNQSQCDQLHAGTGEGAIDSGHSAHTMSQHQGNHEQHLAIGQESSPDAPSDCNHCSTGHCASGCATTLASSSHILAETLVFDTELPSLPGTRTAVAHSFELLRPPSLY